MVKINRHVYNFPFFKLNKIVSVDTVQSSICAICKKEIPNSLMVGDDCQICFIRGQDRRIMKKEKIVIQYAKPRNDFPFYQKHKDEDEILQYL